MTKVLNGFSLSTLSLVNINPPQTRDQYKWW
ncbi:hypothetical protein I503_06200 [Candida albicans SC5314]|nr:hypothetical protein MEY_06136 [Candida albicans 19F]KHC44497.1 hypothetical protein MGC_06116 [Candida albicans P37039]KHC70648.1 hypothetical protein W5Q_06245 [Candida albicans SC5314]KHC77235.1 hypothetical protein I503_06200 [Candida albicans SC5314]